MQFISLEELNEKTKTNFSWNEVTGILYDKITKIKYRQDEYEWIESPCENMTDELKFKISRINKYRGYSDKYIFLYEISVVFFSGFYCRIQPIDFQNMIKLIKHLSLHVFT